MRQEELRISWSPGGGVEELDAGISPWFLIVSSEEARTGAQSILAQLRFGANAIPAPAGTYNELRIELECEGHRPVRRLMTTSEMQAPRFPLSDCAPGNAMNQTAGGLVPCVQRWRESRLPPDPLTDKIGLAVVLEIFSMQERRAARR